MDNSNFWDWDNEDEHRVSSVYRDAEEGNGVIQAGTGQNTGTQNDEIHDVLQNVRYNVSDEQANATVPEVVAENNFILVGNPQTTTPNPASQTGTPYAQTENQQADNPKTANQQTGNQQSENQQIENYQTESQQVNYQQLNNQQPNYQQTANQQPGNQQTEFQQMIPVQNAQQNQGTNRQKAKQTKNADYSAAFDQKDISENKVSAMSAYLLGPVGIIIALLIARDSAYTAFHVRQALKITICSVVLEVIAAILALFAMIPLVGIIFKLVLIITCAIWLGVLVLRLAAIAQVCDGEAREPAIIGKMNCFH